MDLLSRRRRRSAAPALVAFAALSAGATSCLLLRGMGPRPFAFSHAIHVEQEGLECINCHEDVSVGDEPGLPALDGCLFCHESLEVQDPLRRIESLFDEQGFRAVHASRLEDEVVFSHLRHVEAGLDCSACHDGIESSRAIAPQDALSMADCTACHAAGGVANECATCHTAVAADVAPPSHALDWERRHGRVVRAAQAGTANRCDLCHAESACAQCHSVEPPRSHDAHWRLRGHGIFARIDRGSCAACHEPYDCDRCHAETLPRNHTAGFGAPRSRHCLACHQPLRDADCATCHRATPSHDAATPKPAWHSPAMNCRQCHGAGLPLPHPDNGDDCNSCHR